MAEGRAEILASWPPSLEVATSGDDENVRVAPVEGARSQGGSKEEEESPEEQMQNGAVYRIQDMKLRTSNVTGLVHMSCGLDLKKLTANLRNAEYKTGSFRAVYVRMTPRKQGTALIFGSGKVIVTGCKSEAICRATMQRLVKVIHRIQESASLLRCRITAIHVHGFLGFALNIPRLGDEQGQHGAYQHLNFETGLFLRLNSPTNCTFTVFHNGHFVVTGCSRRGDVRKALEAVFPTLCRCAATIPDV